jgi:hypothetical protein
MVTETMQALSLLAVLSSQAAHHAEMEAANPPNLSLRMKNILFPTTQLAAITKVISTTRHLATRSTFTTTERSGSFDFVYSISSKSFNSNYSRLKLKSIRYFV